MTTAPRTTRTGLRSGVAGPVVLVAVLAVTLVGGVLAVTATVVAGQAAGFGALVGVAMVVAFFGVGALVLDVVASLAPSLSLLVALLTYTLQVVLVGLVFAGLTRSGMLDSTLEPRWLGGTVIACTLTWVAAQLVASVRTRRPLYDLPSRTGAGGRSSAKEAAAR